MMHVISIDIFIFESDLVFVSHLQSVVVDTQSIMNIEHYIIIQQHEIIPLEKVSMNSRT